MGNVKIPDEYNPEKIGFLVFAHKIGGELVWQPADGKDIPPLAILLYVERNGRGMYFNEAKTNKELPKFILKAKEEFSQRCRSDFLKHLDEIYSKKDSPEQPSIPCEV